MNKMFYTKLAINNIKNNKRMYLPYMMTCVGTIIMYYLINALSVDKALKSMYGGQYVQSYLVVGTVIIAIFSAIFLFYTNNFLMRNRKKELAMFNILGMEKKHIGLIMLLETLIISIISLIIGIGLGILFSKLALLLLFKILNFDVKFGFSIQLKSIISTVVVFLVIFGLSMLNNLRKVHFTNPIELLSGDRQGEKEPKSRVLLAFLGFITLGAGYYLAIKTKDPIGAMAVFFIAVILVIIGTYLMFMTGSILILKIMRKKKSYYYKTKHFINVSGMIYRMKQNSVGLSNICILSTMVLVTLSSTIALYAGMDDVVTSKVPNDLCIESLLDSGEYKADDDYLSKLESILNDKINDNKENVSKFINYSYVNLILKRDENSFSTVEKVEKFDGKTCEFYFLSAEDYNDIVGENVELNENEALIYSYDNNYDYDDINIKDIKFTIKNKIDKKMPILDTYGNNLKSFFVVLKDKQVVNKIFDMFQLSNEEQVYSSTLKNYVGIDLDITDEEQIELQKNIQEEIKKYNEIVSIDGRVNLMQEILGIYGGLLFLGIFCGILFIIAAVLIMYYKQISEGYDDKRRFYIMQQVGMSKKEIKNAIHSQVLTVFFMPLIVAGIHTAFAFPLISRILALLELKNLNLFAISTISTFFMFGLFYIIVYGMTAKTYYKIVK